VAYAVFVSPFLSLSRSVSVDHPFRWTIETKQMSEVRRWCALAWSLGLVSCVDLSPEVGALIARGNEPVAELDAGYVPSIVPPGDASLDGSADAFVDQEQPSEAGGPDLPDGALADADMPDPPMHDAGPSCGIKDSNPASDVSFEDDIWPILARCSCHDPAADETFGIDESGLQITSYGTLRLGGDNTGSRIVIAGNPCDSIMLQKLSETPPFGERMPNGGPYLTLAERTLLADWIVEGAKDN
jgi:hypothetical protein